MADPYPIRAYWADPLPTVAGLAAGVLGALTLGPGIAWSTDGVSEPPTGPVTGFGLDLPAGARLWFDRIEGRRVELCHSGPDLALPFGEAERAETCNRIEALLAACIASGAVLAWSSGFRDEIRVLDQMDQAMETWQRGRPLPIAPIPGAAAICVWAAALPADLAPVETLATHAIWRAPSREVSA